MERVRRRIVVLELALATGAVFTWGMLTLSVGVPTNGIAVGTIVAALTAALCAGADRSRHGLWLLGAVGALAVVALVLIGTAPWAISALPITMLGLAVGWLLNRIVFGLVRPVPQTRVERGFRWAGFD